MSTGLLLRPSERLKRLREIKPEDFIQPLFISITSPIVEVTSREPIVRGQDYVELRAIGNGALDKIFVWDRPSGGEHVLEGCIERGRGLPAKLGDIITLSGIVWP